LAVDGAGDLAGEIEASIDGIPALWTHDGGRDDRPRARCRRSMLIGNLPRKRRFSPDKLRDIVSAARCERRSAEVWGKKPIVHVHVVEV
jgi:hypothetical protein